MIRHVRLLSTVVLAALSHAPSLRAQSPVAGRWTAEFELGMRNENGVISSMGTGKARMTLEARGDSVFGTWQVLEPANAAAAPARALKGTFKSGALVIETEPRDQQVRIDEQASSIRMLTRYELKLDGDVLAGTQNNVVLGDQTFAPPPRQFRATREKA